MQQVSNSSSFNLANLGVPDHDKISFTAKLVAYCRIHSDIPFAADVSEGIGARQVYEQTCGESAASVASLNWFDALLEARYKSLTQAVLRSGCKQVLEFASGVALRGLAMTLNSDINFVETDLPDITAEKVALVEQVRAKYKLPRPRNLHFANANILVWDEIESALRYLDPNQPVAIIHEGLLPYLSLAEKEMVAANVARILREFGGVWISPDFVTLDEAMATFWRDSTLNGMTDSISKLTQRNFESGCFKNQTEVSELLARNGLVGRVLPQCDGSFELTCLKTKPLAPQFLEQLKMRLTLMEIVLAD